MAKIKIKTLEPGFSPLPSMKQMEMLEAIQKVLGWEYPIPLEEIKREQATDIIERGMRASKRKGLHLLQEFNNKENPEVKKVNEELQTLNNN